MLIVVIVGFNFKVYNTDIVYVSSLDKKNLPENSTIYVDSNIIKLLPKELNNGKLFKVEHTRISRKYSIYVSHEYKVLEIVSENNLKEK